MSETTTQIATLRQQLIEAQENTTVAFFEAQEDLKLLYTQGSAYVNNGIKDDVDSKEASSIVNKINKKHTEIELKRKEVTSILNGVAKDWIEKERAITSESNEIKRLLIQMNNYYVSEIERKAQEAKEKIQKEKDRQIELATLPTRISNCYKTAITEEISNIRQLFAMSWARLTEETFEDKMKVLKSYTHKVSYDKLLTYFKIEPKHLKPEEVENAIKIGLNYDLFCEEFKVSFNEIKKSYIDKIDSKRIELKNQSDSERIKKEQEAERLEIERKVNEMLEKKERETALEISVLNKTIEIELSAQAKMNTVQEAKGRTKWEAFFVGNVDWQKVMELYIEKEGTDKLVFLLNFLKGDRPEIKGIEYKSSKTVINRA